MCKKPDLNVPNTKDNKQFNLKVCIDYYKLNNRILTARQIKADGKLGKVVANYPLPTIDNLLACFKDLGSRYYQINTRGIREDGFCVNIDTGKWKFHSLLFGINLGPSAFSYVLDKVLVSCHKFTLNYL